MSGTAKTYVELELEWSGDYSRSEPDVGYAGGWENVTLEAVTFDVNDYGWAPNGTLTKTKRTVTLTLTPEQVAQFEALFADDAAEEMA